MPLLPPKRLGVVSVSKVQPRPTSGRLSTYICHRSLIGFPHRSVEASGRAVSGGTRAP